MPTFAFGEDSQEDPNVEETNTTEETQEAKEVELSPDEQRAREGGWRPKNEWEGDPDEWVSAKEFNKRGELMQRISAQTRTLKQNEKRIAKLEGAIKLVGEHNQKIAEIEKKKLLDDLNRQKYTAINEGDADKASELDGLISQVNDVKTQQDLLEEEAEADPLEAQREQLQEYFQNWVSKPGNSWYGKDKALTAAFNAIGDDIANQNPNMSIDKLLESAKTQLVKEFPDKFKGRTTSKVAEPSSEIGNNKAPKSKVSLKQLPEEAQTLAKEWDKTGILKIEEFIQQYIEANPEEFA